MNIVNKIKSAISNIALRLIAKQYIITSLKKLEFDKKIAVGGYAEHAPTFLKVLEEYLRKVKPTKADTRSVSVSVFGYRNNLDAFKKLVDEKLNDIIIRYYIVSNVAALQLPEDTSNSIKTIALNTVTAFSYDKPTIKFKQHMVDVAIATAAQTYNKIGAFAGIQPMSGPVAQIFTMQYAKSEQTSESDTMRRMTLEIVANAVEARTRKLNSAYSIEMMQDLGSLNGVDLSSELVKVISEEISNELVSEALTDIINAAPHSEAKFKISDRTTAEYMQKLYKELYTMCGAIASDTLRGQGNVIIIPAKLVPYISNWDVKYDTDYWTFHEFRHMGTINKCELYCANMLEDKILIAYKGFAGETDVGAVYSPYMYVSQIVVDAETFAPKCNFMTRHSNKIINSNYYRVIDVNIS